MNVSLNRPAELDANAELDELLGQIESLAERGVPEQPFYDRLLQGMVESIGAEAALFSRTAGEGLRLIASCPSEPPASAASPRRLLPAVRAGQPRIVAADEFSDRTLLVYPVKVVEATIGVIACVLPAGVASRGQELLAIAAAFAEVADDYELRRQVATLSVGNRLAAQSQQFLLDLHRAGDSTTVARTIAEEGRRLIDCDRLTVLLPKGAGWRVAAVSGVENPSPRSDAVRGAERLVAEALRTGDPVWLEDGADDGHSPALTQELQRHVDSGYARELVVYPCRLPSDADAVESAPIEAALLVEQFDGTLPETVRPVLPLIGDHAAVAVERGRYAGSLGGMKRHLAQIGLAGSLQRGVIALIAAVAVAIAAATLWLIPAELKVAAEGKLVPSQRSRVFAPLDATVSHVRVVHGEKVAKGQVLAELRSEQLEIDLEQALEALATTEQEITALETTKLRAGLPGYQADADVSAVTSRIASLREQVGFQQRRIELLREQQKQLVITSPLDGQVVSWRPNDYLADRPVRRGQRLLEVAAIASNDDAGAWAIEIDVPDRRAGHLLQADAGSDQPLVVEYVMKSAPADQREGRVTNIASATQANAAGDPVVRVEVEPILSRPSSADGATLRNGSTVLAKIHCGQHSLGYVWFHEAWEALQRAWF